MWVEHGVEVQDGDTVTDMDGNSYLPQADMWTAYDQDVYYSWTTGSDNWQQFTSIIDAADNFMTFDPPLHFAYEHATANDLNDDPTYDGHKFSLEYDGFELRVPWNFDPEEEDLRAPLFSYFMRFVIGCYPYRETINSLDKLPGVDCD